MPRFSLKKLILCSSFIAVGVGLDIWACRSWFYEWKEPKYLVAMLPLIFFASGPIVGYGILSLFERPRLGLALGGLFQVALFVVMFVDKLRRTFE